MTATRRTLDIYLTVLDHMHAKGSEARECPTDFKMTIVWYPQSRSSQAKVLKWEKSRVEVEFDFYITFTVRLHEFSLLQRVTHENWPRKCTRKVVLVERWDQIAAWMSESQKEVKDTTQVPDTGLTLLKVLNKTHWTGATAPYTDHGIS